MIQFDVRIRWSTLVATLALVGLLVAVLFPVFAQARSSTGKPNPPLWVAQAIQASELVRGRWPETADEVRPFLRPHPARFDFTIRQGRFEGSDAVYTITADGRTGNWRIPRVDAPWPETVR